MSLEAPEERKELSRREFLKGTATGAGIALAGGVVGEAALLEKIDKETNSHWLTPAAMASLSESTGIPTATIEKVEPNLRRAIRDAIEKELSRYSA